MEANEVARQALSETVDDPLGIKMEVQKIPQYRKVSYVFHTREHELDDTPHF